MILVLCRMIEHISIATGGKVYNLNDCKIVFCSGLGQSFSKRIYIKNVKIY